PVDVRPGTLPHEPARDEGALPDPCDAGDDQERRRRGGPRVELEEFLRAAEDATEPPQRVAPEEGRDGPRSDAVEFREIQPAAPMRASHFVAVVRPECVAAAIPSCVRALKLAGS